MIRLPDGTVTVPEATVRPVSPPSVPLIVELPVTDAPPEVTVRPLLASSEVNLPVERVV